jgi:hypothetical protein
MRPLTPTERATILRLNPQATQADLDELDALQARRVAAGAAAELDDVDRALREGPDAVPPGPAAEAARIHARIAQLEAEVLPRLGEAIAIANEAREP